MNIEIMKKKLQLKKKVNRMKDGQGLTKVQDNDRKNTK